MGERYNKLSCDRLPKTHHLRHFIICKQSLLQNLGGGGMAGGGGKVNQLGYVATHLYMDEFQEMGFCILTGSICIL